MQKKKKTPSEIFVENHGKLPLVRYSRNTMEALAMMNACARDLEYIRETEEKRMRAIPNGMRDIRLAEVLCCNMLAKMLATVEDRKIPTIRASLNRIKHKIIYGKEADTRGDKATVVLNDNLQVIMEAAAEQCRMCYEYDCNHCDLWKALDDCSNLERGKNRNWAEIIHGEAITKEDRIG